MTAASNSRDAADLLHRAAQSHSAGRLDEAERLYRAVLDANPESFSALHALGIIAAQRRDFSTADDLLGQALAVDPLAVDARANRANVQIALGRFADARASADEALRVNPRHAGALYNRALALQRQHRLDEALRDYDAAIAVAPQFVEALANRGAALLDLHRYEEALQTFDRALALRSTHVEALYNRGLAWQRLGNHAEAILSYDRAIGLRPDFPEAHNNRGLNLQAIDRLEEAQASYDRAVALRPDFAEALYNRGTARSVVGRHDDASADFARALALASDLPYAAGALLHARMYGCDWRDYERATGALLADVRAGRRAAEPLTILNISASAADQLTCARTYVDDRFPAAPTPLYRGERYAHERIRVAYLSGDFHDHAVMYLIAGLLERHDRARFEVSGVSFGPDPVTPMRARLKAAFERFIDARTLGDLDVAKRLRELEIDIAVDLNGFTDRARTGVLALRPAPIQVNYLGYPATMGAPYIDYIVGDPIVVPHDAQACYAEKVVYLPDCYQPNDATRAIAEATPSRAECGLPDGGFVFCSFNNNYKITPPIFDVWMRLLREVEGSVLWLLEGNPAAPKHLRDEAVRRGIAGDRLVFAPKRPLAEHLARHRLADLFLDTQPWNAHTTASDALWAGLPLLTCIGSKFAGRVAASLLHAVGVDELVTRSIAEYEALALALARDPRRLADLKERLARNRRVCPLFDTDRSRRALEAAYVEMHARHRRGEPPASFAVPPLG